MHGIIHAIGFWSRQLRSDHSVAIRLIFSISRISISIDFPWPVLSPTPTALSVAVSFMWGFWLRSSREFTQPIARTIPHSLVLGLPLTSGDGRLRASFSVSLRQRAAYS